MTAYGRLAINGYSPQLGNETGEGAEPLKIIALSRASCMGKGPQPGYAEAKLQLRQGESGGEGHDKRCIGLDALTLHWLRI